MRLTFLLPLLTLPALCQPTPDPSLKFEVASIKVAARGPNGVRGGCHGIDSVINSKEKDGAAPLGRCVITDGRLSHMIGIAFGVTMQNLESGDDWIQRGDLRFDVQAKAEDPAKYTEKQLLAMLQNLLIERFQLKFHYVNSDQPGFSVTVGKNGPKLQKSTSTEVDVSAASTGSKSDLSMKPGAGVPRSLHFRKYTIPMLVSLLSQLGAYGPGVDKTGLTGEYDFTLSWNEQDGPTLGTALRDQLGLQMKSEKVPVATFVVDSAQKPASN